LIYLRTSGLVRHLTSNLVAYKGPPFNPDNTLVDLDKPTPKFLFEGPHFPPLPTTNDLFIAEQIDSIKDNQIISTRDDGCRRHLVCWKGRSESDDTWIIREDLQRLAPDLLEFYESHSEPYSTGSSSFHLGCADVGASHWLFLYAHISAVAVVSHRH